MVPVFAAQRAAKGLARVENSSASANANGEYRDRSAPPPPPPWRNRCRNGTVRTMDSVPFRDRPRLSAAFAAQILGQVLGQIAPPSPPLPRQANAYRKAAAKPHGFDEIA